MRVFIAGIDGYLGWTLAQYLAARKHKVGGCDFLLRRQWVEEMQSQSAMPISSMTVRKQVFKEKYGDLDYYYGDLCDYKFVWKCLKYFNPEAIVHLGEMPSAPYSMIDNQHAVWTQKNNIVGTLNLLYAMKELCPKAQLVKLGTMGSYGTPNIDIPEGFFEIEYRGRKDRLPFPRQAGSWYHQCYDEDTEILSENGWKNFSKLKIGEKVATLNVETDTLEYQVPTNYTSYNYNGEMYQVRNRRLDLLVTPNHTMLVGNTNRKTKRTWKLLPVEQVYGVHKIYKKTVKNWNGELAEVISIPSAEVKINGSYKKIIKEKSLETLKWVKFLGWYLSEGQTYHKEGSTRYRITILQEKVENHKEIIDAINSLGYKCNPNRSCGKVVGFTITNSQLGQYLDRFGISHERYIPSQIKNLPREYLRVLIDTMVKGDGSHNGRSISYYTKSKQLADDMQEVALKAGYSASIWRVKNRDSNYVVGLSESKDTQIILKQPNRLSKIYDKKHYDGKVYCCEVPNGVIFVRRNGKSVWCGNSKVHDSHNIMFACKIWGLKSTDIMQGVVYGTRIPEMGDDNRLFTRFDFDQAFGTCLNRFCTQAVIRHPLTAFGAGNQKRGFLPLKDSMQCLTLAIENPPKEGEYRVFNQFEETYTVMELAKKVKKVGDSLGLGVQIGKAENPRKEMEEHYYNPDHQHLLDLGYKPTHDMESELKTILQDLMKYRDRIEEKKRVIMPDIRWDGTRRVSDFFTVEV